MGNKAGRELIRKMRGGRITRRQFIQRASALGLSATAISSALRANPSVAQSATEVVFWTTHSEPDLSTLRAIVAAFNAENPDVKARLVRVVGDSTDTTKLMTAVRGGIGPDVYMLDRFIVAQRAAEGVLQELTGFIGGEDLREVYIPFAWAEANFQGKPYALPFDTDARALYFNKELLQIAGANPAELDVANGAITFDRLAAIANSINETDADGNFSRMGFVPFSHQALHYTYGFAFGGSFFDAASCRVTPDNAGVVAGHQWLYDYVAALGAQKVNTFGGPYAATVSVPVEQDLFITQRVAFAIIGDWAIAQLAHYAPDVDYGITFMPVPKEGDASVTWAGGWSMVIPRGAKNPEGAWRFMRYIAGEPGQRTYTTETAHLPTIRKLLDDADLFTDERRRFFAQQLLPTAQNRPSLPVGAEYWNELTAAWQKIYLNEEEPAAALATVKDRVQPDLDPYCPIGTSE